MVQACMGAPAASALPPRCLDTGEMQSCCCHEALIGKLYWPSFPVPITSADPGAVGKEGRATTGHFRSRPTTSGAPRSGNGFPGEALPVCWAGAVRGEITAGPRLSDPLGKLAIKHPWAGGIVHFQLRFWPVSGFRFWGWVFFQIFNY